MSRKAFLFSQQNTSNFVSGVLYGRGKIGNALQLTNRATTIIDATPLFNGMQVLDYAVCGVDNVNDTKKYYAISSTDGSLWCADETGVKKIHVGPFISISGSGNVLIAMKDDGTLWSLGSSTLDYFGFTETVSGSLKQNSVIRQISSISFKSFVVNYKYGLAAIAQSGNIHTTGDKQNMGKTNGYYPSVYAGYGPVYNIVPRKSANFNNVTHYGNFVHLDIAEPNGMLMAVSSDGSVYTADTGYKVNNSWHTVLYRNDAHNIPEFFPSPQQIPGQYYTFLKRKLSTNIKSIHFVGAYRLFNQYNSPTIVAKICAITNSGTIESTTPELNGMTGVVSIVRNGNHAYIEKTDGTVDLVTNTSNSMKISDTPTNSAFYTDLKVSKLAGITATTNNKLNMMQAKSVISGSHVFSNSDELNAAYLYIAK